MKGWLALIVFAHGVLAVTDSGTHSFQVWIAADDQSHSRGLMHLRELLASHGMLFLYETSGIRADGVVVTIARDARPMSLDPIFSTTSAKAVLELIAGSAERMGLEVGDRFVHPALAAQPERARPGAG